MNQSGGEQRRPVLFSGHGMAFVVICVIFRVLNVKRIYILLSWKINHETSLVREQNER
jgi:hypothetical protein